MNLERGVVGDRWRHVRGRHATAWRVVAGLAAALAACSATVREAGAAEPQPAGSRKTTTAPDPQTWCAAKSNPTERPPGVAAALFDVNERFREAHRRARAAECQALESQKLLIRYAFGSVEARFRGMDLGSPVVLYTPYVHALKAISHTIFLAELLSHEAAGPDRDAHVAGALRDLEALRAELAAPGSEVAKLLPPDELAQQLEILTRTEDALSRFRAGRLDEAGRRAYLAAVRPLMNANLRRASAAILTRLHETVMGYKKEVDVRDPAAWASLVVIAGVSHQARAREIGVQYFERLLGESAAEGASGEDRLVVVEGQSVPADQRGTLAAHAVDRVHAGEIFGAANRLQSDVMADSSDALDVLFPTTKKTTSRVTGNAVQSKRHDARTPSPDP